MKIVELFTEQFGLQYLEQIFEIINALYDYNR